MAGYGAEGVDGGQVDEELGGRSPATSSQNAPRQGSCMEKKFQLLNFNIPQATEEYVQCGRGDVCD